MDSKDFGLDPATYFYSNYKNDVETALIDYFGNDTVSRGNKAFDIHANTYRVDADVVVCFRHHRYKKGGDYLEGTAFDTDGGKRIINWPDQNYDNGVQKNKETRQRFKSVVRILKQLRNTMTDDNIPQAMNVPSYLIECLAWNVPNASFGHDTYTADVRDTLAHLFNETMEYETCKEWGEINELKYLFRASQPWNLTQAHAFLSASWNYIGFK